MTQVSLPRTSQTGTNEWSDVEQNDQAIIDVVNGNLDVDNLSATAGITGGQIAAGAAIAGSKLDTTDGRLPQTTGLVVQTVDLALTSSYADVTGATVTFTPDVACYALVQLAFCIDAPGNNYFSARLMVDGVGETAEARGRLSGSQVYRVTLTAAAHTLKMQAKHGGSAGTLVAACSRFTYELVAQ